jgi:dTDP-4-amino-4,6-dideoxygalactose transaminase
MSEPFLPYALPAISQADIDSVSAVMWSKMLTTGPVVEKFETEFKALTQSQHAVSCSNGTTALNLLAMALALSRREPFAVVVPAITFLASASAFAMTGARIVFADVDPRSGLMTAETAEAAVKRSSLRVGAIVTVHLGGRISDLPGLRQVADRCGAILIEDACHAVGSTYPVGNTVGAVGDCQHSEAAAFSFHPTKTLTSGEGGMVTTNNAALADKVRLLRNHGMSRTPPFVNDTLALDPLSKAQNPWFYEMTLCSLNFRLSDMHAALGLSQLQRLNEFIATRYAVREIYDAAFADCPAFAPVAPRREMALVDHLYQINVDFPKTGMTRAAAMKQLVARGIGTQVHYIPVNRQPYYAQQPECIDLPGADAFYAGTLSLPFHNVLTTDDARRVTAAIVDVLKPS